jgi:SAM-dependent methyltransferase
MNGTAAIGERSSASEWFSTWFDTAHFQQLYAHRGAREAGALLDRLIARLQPPDGAAILDLARATGRHARHLAARGFDVTGLDLSATSIARARQPRRSAPPVPPARHADAVRHRRLRPRLQSLHELRVLRRRRGEPGSRSSRSKTFDTCSRCTTCALKGDARRGGTAYPTAEAGLRLFSLRR